MLTVLPIDGEGPMAIDLRCLRLGFAAVDPSCCGRGVPIDLRARIEIGRVLPMIAWDDAPPTLDGRAPSGVVARLSDVADRCAALDHAVPGGGVDGRGCRLRPEWLPDGCALFPLDLEGEVLVPSPRITTTAGSPNLYELARARLAVRFGQGFVDACDAAIAGRAVRLRILG
jgi:hypothetical protein